MRVYLSGPMRGRINFNYDAFHKAEEAIRAIGHEVVNPARNFGGRQDLPYHKYIDLALEQVATCDIVVKLPGWQASNGVKQELKVAFDRQIETTTFEAFTGLVGPQNPPDLSAQFKSEPQPRMEEPPRRITEEAYDLVVQGDRQSNYGHPEQDFRTTGRQWGALIDNWLKANDYAIVHNDGTDDDQEWVDVEAFPDVPPKIVALMMASLKASRESQRPGHDNRVDGIGYWLCADRIEEGY